MHQHTNYPGNNLSEDKNFKIRQKRFLQYLQGSRPQC